jgi:hypothetical protein
VKKRPKYKNVTLYVTVAKRNEILIFSSRNLAGRFTVILMHLSILIPGGKGAGNGWGFDKKLKNWVKCPLVGVNFIPRNQTVYCIQIPKGQKTEVEF